MLSERAQRARVRGEVHFRRPDGSTFPADLSSTLLSVVGSEPITLILFRDLSDRQRVERLLRESEDQFRVAFQTLPDAVTLTEVQTGRFVAVNEGCHAVTGWREGEMVGRTATELRLRNDDDRPAFLDRLQAAGFVRDFVTHLRRKDGAVIDVVLSARPLVAAGRRLLLTVTRDVTPLLSAERARDTFREHLRQSQQLETVGRLASGVAHDFNNLLTVILSCSEALREEERGPGDPDHPGSAAAPQEGREEIAEIQAAAQRARELTRQLLDVARRQGAPQGLVDPAALLGRCERLLRRLLGEDVDLSVRAPPGLWSIRGDPVQLDQIVLNLAVNSRDALPHGGLVLVEAVNTEVDGLAETRFPGARPGRYVRLAVQDDGVGMPEAVRDRAFEPFFTTKDPGKGTGLGLATVRDIVERSGGFLRLDSEPGRGTRVEVLFPAVAAPPPASSVAAPDLAPSKGETILLVEDEVAVREVIGRFLGRAGYRVLIATRASEALALAAAGESIALVIADVVLPELGGRAVVEALRKLRPGLKALFVSGYPHELILSRGMIEPGVELLDKPFASSELLARVRALLDA
jgi:PAS domain S-box-containing protein